MRNIQAWFIGILTLISLMVLLGGATRLTGSGLSITEWKPIMGAIPPLNLDQWNEAFEKYKQIPQYQILNQDMTLSEFKFIFFWEWFHRLVGRLLGIFVALPLFAFTFKKSLPKPILKRAYVGLVLGGAQGFLGWFMVKSGLSELVYVSHFRLAAHLTLALFILAYWMDLYLRWKNFDSEKTVSRGSVPCSLKALTAVFVIQIFYGAFVAGLKAGHVSDTYPQMLGQWIPQDLFDSALGWIRFLSHGVAVHWIHRWLGLIVLLLVFWEWSKVRKTISALSQTSNLFLALIITQFGLGIATVLSGVNFWFALFHQLNICFLVMLLAKWIKLSRA